MKKALEEAEAMRLAAEQEIAKLAAEKSALTRESEEARAEQVRFFPQTSAAWNTQGLQVTCMKTMRARRRPGSARTN